MAEAQPSMNPPPSTVQKPVLLILSGLFWAGVFAGQSAPQFAPPQPLTNGEVLLQLNASPGVNCRIDLSPDLIHWDPFLTLSSTGLNHHVDSAAPYVDTRFYRAIQLEGPGIVTGDHLVTTDGDVVIHPINHASLVLRWNDRMIYVDPVGGAAPYQGLPRADLILITHNHGDHYNASTLEAVLATPVSLIAPQAVYNAMSATLRSFTTVLANGATTTALGLTIEAVPAYNLTTSNHPLGVGNGYVLTIGDKRIYISGDSEDTPEMRALSSIDLAFVSMNVPYTMSEDKAARAVRDFRPRVVFPYHYRNQSGYIPPFADLDLFKRLVGTDLGVEVRLREWY